MEIEIITAPKLAKGTWILPVKTEKGKIQWPDGLRDFTTLGTKSLSRGFRADVSEVFPVWQEVPGWLLGLGNDVSGGSLYRIFRKCAVQQLRWFTPQLTIDLRHFGTAAPAMAEAMVCGLMAGTSKLSMFKSKATELHPLSVKGEIYLLTDESVQEQTLNAAEKALHLAQAQVAAMEWINTPANYKTPAMLAQWAIESGQRHGVRVEVFGREQILKMGLHALAAVNRGSEHPAQFIVMEYKPKTTKIKKLQRIGLVGKGVTFDTGGVSIKGSANMHYMKSDMGGAAAVMSAVEAVARLQVSVHLMAAIPATDNLVDALSIKPGDVINSYSTKTIEIIDTDAEGRLIMADALSYLARVFKPDYLLDMATLTGAAVRTFGYHAAALFSTSKTMEQTLMQAAQDTGERLWPLPMWEVYAEDIHSDVADVRNFSGKPVAGAISAAKFLEVFTDHHPAWAHIDIAPVAFGDTEFGKMKNATGYGVRLLVRWMEIIAALQK